MWEMMPMEGEDGVKDYRQQCGGSKLQKGGERQEIAQPVSKHKVAWTYYFLLSRFCSDMQNVCNLL